MSWDVSKIYVPVCEPTNGIPLAEFHSALTPFSEFHVAGDDRIRIAALTSDIDSPFVLIKDRETMLKALFDFLGLEDEKLLIAIIKYKDDLTSFASLRYLQILHETDFTSWLLARRDYDIFLQKSNEGQAHGESDDKFLARRNKIRETIKTLGQEMREIEAKLFPDSKAAREAAVAESKNRITLFAEKYAEENTYI